MKVVIIIGLILIALGMVMDFICAYTLSKNNPEVYKEKEPELLLPFFIKGMLLIFGHLLLRIL